MKKLEEIIRKNIMTFDIDEPSPDHIDKFRDKLDNYHVNYKRGKFYKFLGYAASIAAVFILIFIVVRTLPQFSLQNNGSNEITQELEEIETYFMSRIETNYEALNKGLDKCPKQKEEASSCFKELDESFKNLQKDLLENPGDEHVINAVINYYQLKLEIINQIIRQTKIKRLM